MLDIGSARTGQKLFTVRSFGGGQLNLPPEKARAFLEFLRDLGDASIFIQVVGAEPVPAECMLGGTISRDLEAENRLAQFRDDPANDAALSARIKEN